MRLSFKDWFEHQLEKSIWTLDRSDLIKLKKDKLENIFIYSCNYFIFAIAMLYLLINGINAWGIVFGLFMMMWFLLIIENGSQIRHINFVMYEKFKEEKI